MRFDVIIGNPPYNNDLYLDFVVKSHRVAKYNVCMITPAKWHAKNSVDNEFFRDEIVPYMTDIVYFPYTPDVFDIISHGGITYYLISNRLATYRNLTTKCKVQKLFETKGVENIIDEDLNILYNKKIRDIVRKLGVFDSMRCMNNATDGMYNIGITNIYAENTCTSRNGTANVTVEPYITTSALKKNVDTSFLDSFDTELEAKSYISYINTKFVRFLLLISKATLHLQGDGAWSIVPKPCRYDHIYTDNELYTKYNLTDDEINIIEKVIRKRR